MPRTDNQKKKPLVLYQILHEYTGDTHGLTMTEILSKLKGYGIAVKRRSIYDDTGIL